MSTQVSYPHLTISADGVARIGNSRFKVIHLAAEHYHDGWTAEELMREHPELRPEEVYSALTYFYDHREEMIAEMKATLAASIENWPAHSLSRSELLSRKGLGEIADGT